MQMYLVKHEELKVKYIPDRSAVLLVQLNNILQDITEWIGADKYQRFTNLVEFYKGDRTVLVAGYNYYIVCDESREGLSRFRPISHRQAGETYELHVREK